MKIGMILDQTFPPDPRVENEAVELIKNGHEVFLFCLTYDDNEPKEEEIHGIQVKRFLSNTKEYKLSALAYTFPFYAMAMKKKIKKFLRNFAIEAIHVHDMVIAGTVFSVNKKMKLPLVLDLHENRPEIMQFYPHLQKFPGNFLISLQKWKKKEADFIRKADKVVVVTNEAKKELLSRCTIPKENVIVVPNTVRKSFFNKVVEAKTSKDFNLLYIVSR